MFGSRATRQHRPTSDADIAIMPGRPLDLLTEACLADRLAQALQVPAVDLVDLRRAPLRLRGRVLAEGQRDLPVAEYLRTRCTAAGISPPRWPDSRAEGNAICHTNQLRSRTDQAPIGTASSMRSQRGYR
ncbi:MAG: nucleotidyltransferase domain-containing protein, partial [Pseudonocardiaceae bacterium]